MERSGTNLNDLLDGDLQRILRVEIDKHEFIHIRMHSTEVSKFKMLLEEISSGNSNSGDWAKKYAEEIIKQIDRAKK